MELEKQCADGSMLLYRESFFTGKKELFVDGKPTYKYGKKIFRIDLPKTEDSLKPSYAQYTIRGNFISGVSISTSSGENVVLAKNKWYDWLMILLPFVGIPFAIFCGAIGGGLAGALCFLGAYINAALARTKIPVIGRIILQLLVAAAANAAWFGLYSVIVVALFT